MFLSIVVILTFRYSINISNLAYELIICLCTLSLKNADWEIQSFTFFTLLDLFSRKSNIYLGNRRSTRISYVAFSSSEYTLFLYFRQ